MAKTRKSSRRGVNIIGKLYAPFHHFFQATGESVGAVGRSAGNIVKKGINTVDSVGTSYSRHGKMMLNNILSRKGSRKGSRKSRKGSRKSRKASRSSRR